MISAKVGCAGLWGWTSMGLEAFDFSEATKAELSDGRWSWRWETFVLTWLWTARVNSMCLHPRWVWKAHFCRLVEHWEASHWLGQAESGQWWHQRCDWDNQTGWISPKKVTSNSHIMTADAARASTDVAISAPCPVEGIGCSHCSFPS